MEGIARYIYETTKRMVLAHPEDEFHFFFDRAYDEQFIFAENIKAHILYPPSRHPILWYLWFEQAVPRALKRIKADVFYSGDMYLSLKTSTPTLMVSHDLGYEHYPQHLRWSHKKYMLHYSPKYHRKADHLIAVSEATKQDIIKTYSIPANNISVATNALRDGFRSLDNSEIAETRKRLSDSCPYFIYVGSLHPRKNIEGLLLAFELFKKENKEANQKLILFGRHAFKTQKIMDVYENMVYKNEVLFLNDKDAPLSDLLAAAEALCYVSLFEGFGIPILEAFASGVPVITSNVSSMPEVAGKAAILVDPRNTIEIADAMYSIYSNTNKRSQLISEGQKQLGLFSWDRSARIIYEQLERLQ